MDSILQNLSILRKKLEKVTKKLLKMLISVFFEHSFHEKRFFTRNAIKSVTDVIFQFCFHLQQADRSSFVSNLSFSERFVLLKEI